jgi:hypothetical protein
VPERLAKVRGLDAVVESDMVGPDVYLPLIGQEFSADDFCACAQGTQLAAGDLTRQGAMPQLVQG